MKTIHWNDVRLKIKNEPWASRLAESMATDFATTTRLMPPTPPLEASAWFHYYFCKQCAMRLNFNLATPHEHVCPTCGKVYTGDPYNGVWRKLTHSAFISMLEYAAILANVFKGSADLQSASGLKTRTPPLILSVATSS